MFKVDVLVGDLRVLRHGQFPLTDGVFELLGLQPQLLLRFGHLLQRQTDNKSINN